MNLSPNESRTLRALAIRGESLVPVPEGPVVWASSNIEVATVDAGGVVKAVAPGRAKIRVEWAGFSDAIEVVVETPAIPPTGVKILL